MNSNVQPIHQPSAQANFSTLDEVLIDLSRFGEPRLSMSSGFNGKSGWFCGIDVFITGEGIQFKITSEFYHAKPMGAASQCHERLLLALNDIANKVKLK